MTNTLTLPRLLTEEEKQGLVRTLKNLKWNKCVTLTHRFETEAPETLLELHNFIRRLNGMTQKKTNYWFTITENRSLIKKSDNWRDELSVPVHIHGVLDEVGDLTAEQIASCWRTTPKEWINPSTGKAEVRPFSLGMTLITDFNLDPEWHFYMANQTRKGWTFTNIAEFREGK
jgi:hypothetical protein